MSKKVRVQFYDATLARLAIDSFRHFFRSGLFNPPISVILNLEKLDPSLRRIYGEKTLFRVRLISDGQKAYLKFLAPEP